MVRIGEVSLNNKQVICKVCGRVVTRKQPHQKYCGGSCKVLAQYRRQVGGPISDAENPHRRRRRVHQEGGGR